jgi:hypothetical protein
MMRREFLKACGLVAVGTALVSPVRALARRAEPEPAALPPDSAYERMKKLRIDYMLAAGDTQRRFELNRQLMGLAFEMKDAGASRAHIMTMGQATLYHAKREVARLRALA